MNRKTMIWILLVILYIASAYKLYLVYPVAYSSLDGYDLWINMAAFTYFLSATGVLLLAITMRLWQMIGGDL